MGKTGHDRQESSGEYFLKAVTEAVHGSNRSIICDNWFTTIPLMKEVYKEPFNLNITGTIRKNKKQIPNEMKIASKEVPATKFCHHEDITLASYTPKKNKVVLLVSNKIHTNSIGEGGKPEMVIYYNKNKGGTDVFDKLCHAYTTTRSTKRWPMRYFFGMLDQSHVNARILYLCKHANNQQKMKMSATSSLKQLVMHLVKPHLLNRLQNSTLRLDLKKGIQNILELNDALGPVQDRPQLAKRARCGLCPSKKDRKTSSQCPSCLRPMCDDHRAYFCNDCAGYQS